MFCTKNIIADFSEVPKEWVYFYYLGCKGPFDGTSYKIVSPFLRGQKKDKDASLGIYVKNDEYIWNDLGLGLGGNTVFLVKKLFNINYFEAKNKILEDYNKWIITEGECTFKASDLKETKILEIKEICRDWNTNDKRFWTKYYLGSKDLEGGFTRALSEYTLIKGDKEAIIKGEYIYGFYTRKGELYKIYQPYIKDCKYLTVKNFISGSDSEQKYEYLAILAGHKDEMAFNKLKLHMDVRVPTSENSIINENLIKEYKNKYKKILVIFDSDEAGIKAMQKYKDRYNIDYIVIPEKDIADLLKIKGIAKSRDIMIILINKKLNEI